ncbi:MAG: protein kinase domain-containing protein [Planctomycetota bacterium]
MAERPSQIGPFDIIEELGRGAMGVVYRARHRELDREFALKVVGAGVSERPDALARFRREAQAAARLADHPNIVGVHQIGESDGTAWFSMDLIDGESLEKLIDEGDLPLDEAVRILAATARAVDYAHDQSVLHRDLKPANILVGHDGEVYVTDFGLARLQDVHGDLTRITTSDLLVGTPAYMAPEQIHGESLDGRADVYALGATLYEAITGQTPFPGHSILSVLTKVVQEPPALPSSLMPGISADLEAITLRAMAKAPVDRYPTAVLFAEELEAFAAGKPILARRSSAIGRLGKRMRRSRRGMLLGAVVGAAVTGVAATAWIVSTRDHQATEAAQTAHAGATSAERASGYAAAHFQIERDAADAVAYLVHKVHGGLTDPAEVERAVARVQAVAKSAAEQHPGAKSPAAWLAFATYLDDPSEETYTVMMQQARAEQQDPFPAILGARAALLQYVSRFSVPIRGITGDEILRYQSTVHEDTKQFREDLLFCLGRITGSPHWRDVPQAEDIERFHRGAQYLTQEKWSKVEEVYTPLLDDPHIGGEARDLVAHCQFERGEYLTAARSWAVLADRGWWGAMEQLSTAYRAAVSKALQAGEDAGPAAAEYREAITRLEQHHAESAHAWRVVSLAYRWLGEIARNRNADPRKDFEASVTAAERLLQVKDTTVWGHLCRGKARLELYRIASERGQGAEELFEGARADLNEAIVRRPDDPAPVSLLGILHVTAADYAPRSDPRVEQLFEQAIVYFTKAAEQLQDDGVRPDHSNRAAARLQLAQVLALTGRERPELIDRALEDLSVSADAYPQRLEIFESMASCHLFRAEQFASKGRDPRTDLQRAIDIYNAILARSPSRTATFNNRGLAWRQMGDTLRLMGRPSMEAFDHAVSDLRAAVTRAPGEPSYRMNLASCLRSRSEAKRLAGTSPVGDLRLAIPELDRAAELHPRSVEVLGTRGQVYAGLAKYGPDIWAERSEDWKRALADLTAAVEISPRDIRGLASRADVQRDYAQALADHGHDGVPQMIEALQGYSEALELVPGHPVILYNRAVAWERVGYWTRQQREDPREAYGNALDDLQACVKANPRLAPGWQLMARLHKRLGHFEESLAAYDRALRLRPGFAQYVKERAEVAKLLAERDR